MEKLAIVVPMLNESKHIARLISSLSSQSSLDQVYIVFVDNDSSDGTLDLVRNVASKSLKKYEILQESKKGKWAAVEAATKFISSHTNIQSVAIMDADSYYHSTSWIKNTIASLPEKTAGFYMYGPFHYYGFEHLPRFYRLYLSYNKVLSRIMRDIGWFGSGQNVVYNINDIQSFLDAVDSKDINEDDLKSCLFLLNNGCQCIYNPETVITSGRRIIKSLPNFKAWINYDTSFYQNRWGSVWEKEYNHIQDIAENEVMNIFKNRATKLVTRNLLPLAIFDQKNGILDKLLPMIQSKDALEVAVPKIHNLINHQETFELFIDELSKSRTAEELSAIFFEEMQKTFLENNLSQLT